MKTLSILFMFAFVHLCCSLKCNLCIGSLDGHCAQGDVNEMVVQDCGSATKINSNLHLGKSKKLNTKKLDVRCVAVGAKVNGMVAFQRGCGYVDHDVDICEYLNPLVEELYSCSYCDTDLCTP